MRRSFQAWVIDLKLIGWPKGTNLKPCTSSERVIGNWFQNDPLNWTKEIWSLPYPISILIQIDRFCRIPGCAYLPCSISVECTGILTAGEISESWLMKKKIQQRKKGKRVRKVVKWTSCVKRPWTMSTTCATTFKSCSRLGATSRQGMIRRRRRRERNRASYLRSPKDLLDGRKYFCLLTVKCAFCRWKRMSKFVWEMCGRVCGSLLLNVVLQGERSCNL